MTTPAALLLMVLFSLPGFGPKPGVQHIAGWTLTVQKDKFSGALRCQLKRRNVEYLRKALILHGPAQLDTSRALYRIDDGQPIAVSKDQMELAALGFQLENEDLLNPSQGIVRIPLTRLDDPRLVWVQPAPGRRAARFEVSGLRAALEAASRAGCEDTSFG